MIILYQAFIKEEKDKTKFELLYLKYKNQMLNVAYSVLHDQYESEDAVHTAFIGIAKNMDKIEEIDSNDSRNYCLKSAKNTALNILNKNKNIVDMPFDDTLNNESISDDFVETICDKADVESIKKVIDGMDDIYRDVLTMYFLYEMSAGQIASLFSRKEETVRKQLFRGKQILRDMLKGGIDNG
ncbi:MAG: RNA polymerase sigma factor [Ruminococcus sp.]